MKRLGLLLMVVLFVSNLKGQEFHQTVRGIVIDKESNSPVEFAAVMLVNTTFSGNAITNQQGEFRFDYVPAGRVRLQVSCIGYESITLSNLDVTMGKELILTIEMVESVTEIEEVRIKAFHNKEKPINSYAPVSALTFSVEESMRYAGSDNDVSRMAMNFAGVSQLTETSNGIIIRGNSPVGVLFRLDGVDIPNPNHFGDGSSTGGVMNMLNNNVLANSDFLTGAFPAEYGNALSGVFDLRMRNGNNEKHEFLGQISLMGTELGAEGPIIKNNNSSYLINYRYSTIGLLNALGMSPMGTAVTEYQDVSFKFNFPSTKIGNLSLFGLGGKSYVKMFDSERDTTQERQQMAYESDYEMNMLNDNYSGSVGLVHSYLFGNSAYTRLILSATTIWNHSSYDSLSTKTRTPIQQYYSDFSRTKYAVKLFLNKKINRKNTLKTGVSAEIQQFDMLDSMLVPEHVAYKTLRDYHGDDMLSQAFIQHKHKFNPTLELVAGINALLLASNNNTAIEPRVALSWQAMPNHTFSFGYGLHSVTTPVEIANQERLLETGELIKPNTDLEFTKSHHFVLGYDTRIFEHVRFKSEVYYQYLYNTLVEKMPGSYSWLNHGAYTIVDVGSLKNGGEGINYGIEFTTEKFMDKGAYFLSTLSLFESKYRGSDGVLRNTAFNTNYVFNLLGGKEFTIGKNRKRSVKKLVLDGKINWTGGQRYSPIDLEKSEATQTTVFIDSKAFSNQLPDYFRVDIRLGYTWSKKNSTQELAMDIRNVTNRQNPFYVKYNIETGEVDKKGFGIMPNILYRISF